MFQSVHLSWYKALVQVCRGIRWRNFQVLLVEHARTFSGRTIQPPWLNFFFPSKNIFLGIIFQTWVLVPVKTSRKLWRLSTRQQLAIKTLWTLHLFWSLVLLTRKRTSYFWEWRMHSCAVTNGPRQPIRCARLLICNHFHQQSCAQMGVQIASKTHSPSVSSIQLGSSRNVAGVCFAGIQKGRETFVTAQKTLTFPRMCGSIYVIIFIGVVLSWDECHAELWFGQKLWLD